MALLGTEGTWNREWLIWTLGSFSIENITVLAGAGNLPTGRMLGKITASGKYKNYDDTAADGTQAAAGILLDDCDATGAADVSAVLLVRHAIVKDSLITAATAGHKTAGKTDLAATFVLFR